MDTSSIKGQFTRFIKETMGSKNPRLNGWYCGITNNENRRKAEHNYVKGKIKHWKCINASTMKKASEVEAYFSVKGTSNLPSPNGANKSSKWVYIFKMPSNKKMGLGGVVTGSDFYNYVFGE